MAVSAFRGFYNSEQTRCAGSSILGQSDQRRFDLIMEPILTSWAWSTGDKGVIKVGKNSNLQDGVLVRSVKATPGNKSQGSEIGSNVTIGHGAILNGVTIEDEAFIGIGAILQEGVKVCTCLTIP